MEDTIQIEWNVCLGDTSVQILDKLQEIMSETGHVPESFHTDSRKKVQVKCLDSVKKVASYAARFRPCYWGPGSAQTWKYNESRPATHFGNGERDELASVVKHASNRVLKSKKKGNPGMHFKSDARNNVMLVNMVLVGNQLCLFFAVKKRIRHKMPVQFLSPTAIVIGVSVVQDPENLEIR